MRKSLCLLLLSALLLLLVSCNRDERSDDPGMEPPDHVHSFGDWEIVTPANCFRLKMKGEIEYVSF